MKHISLRTKVTFLLASLLVVTNTITASLFIHSLRSDGAKQVEIFRHDAIENVRSTLEQQVQIAYGVLDQYKDSVEDDASRARHQADAKRTLDVIRFGKTGYFFAYQYDGVNRVLPTKPDWVGKNKWETPDKHGVPFVQLLVAAGRRGGDTTRWAFDKPGTTIAADKLGYCKGFDKWGWTLGTGVYVDDIDSMVAAKQVQIDRTVRDSVLGAGIVTGLCVLVLCIATVFISEKALLPLDRLKSRLTDISQGSGDLTQRIEVHHHDEIGRVAESFNVFVGHIHSLIRDVAGRTGQLGQSARDVRGISHETASSAEEMEHSSRTMAAAVEESSTNLREIAASVSESGQNITTIAAALEEMSASLEEVSRSCQQEAGVAKEASHRVGTTQAGIEILKQSAQDIGIVLEVIFDIAEQTKLLALNATIEAARAGDAGKGFAVVAGEVKELARLSAESTGKIREKVEAIQTQTSQAVSAMAEVAQEVSKVDGLSMSIQRAVQEQSATIGEISRNVALVEQKTRSISSGTGQSAQGLAEVSTGIAQMHDAIRELAGNATRMESAAKELDSVSEKLGADIGRFRY